MRPIHNARSDGIHIDAIFDQVQPSRLRHRNDRRLGGTIDQNQALAAPSGLRCHIDDLAAMTLCNHLPRRGLHGKERSGHIDRKEPLIAFAGDIDGFSRIKEGCIVQQNVDFSGLGHDLSQCCVNAGLIRHIQRHRIGAFAQLCCRGLCGVKIDICDGNRCAFFKIFLRKAAPNAARGAGDEGGFSVQPGHVFVLCDLSIVPIGPWSMRLVNCS